MGTRPLRPFDNHVHQAIESWSKAIISTIESDQLNGKEKNSTPKL